MITYGPDFYELSKLLVNYINNYEICKCDKDIKSIDAKDISYELIYPFGMNNYFDSSLKTVKTLYPEMNDINIDKLWYDLLEMEKEKRVDYICNIFDKYLMDEE